MITHDFKEVAKAAGILSDDWEEICSEYVYRFSNRIIKQLIYRSEEKMYRRLKGKSLKHVVKVYDVVKKGDYHYGVFELLKTYKDDISDDKRELIEVVRILSNRDSSWAMNPWKESYGRLDNCHRIYADKFKLENLVKCVKRNKIFSNDLHQGNMGWRGNVPVAFDLVCGDECYDDF